MEFMYRSESQTLSKDTFQEQTKEFPTRTVMSEGVLRSQEIGKAV